jgi:hypothetical protein
MDAALVLAGIVLLFARGRRLLGLCLVAAGCGLFLAAFVNALHRYD